MWGYGVMVKDSNFIDKKFKYVFEFIFYVYFEEKKFLWEGKLRWVDLIKDEIIKKVGSMVLVLKKYVNFYLEMIVSVDY